MTADDPDVFREENGLLEDIWGEALSDEQWSIREKLREREEEHSHE